MSQAEKDAQSYCNQPQDKSRALQLGAYRAGAERLRDWCRERAITVLHHYADGELIKCVPLSVIEEYFEGEKK